MSLVAGYRVDPYLSPEGALYNCQNPALNDMLAKVRGLYGVVAGDARRNEELIDPFERGLRLREAAAISIRHSRFRAESQEVALSLLAGASHYRDLKDELDNDDCLPRHKAWPMVHFVSNYNGLIEEYGELQPKTRIDDFIGALVAARTLIGHEDVRLSRAVFEGVTYGALAEIWGLSMLSFAGKVRKTDTRGDLQGRDAVLLTSEEDNEAMPVDIAGSKGRVFQKCGDETDSSGWWGVKDGVLVLWPGVARGKMGPTFEVNMRIARQKYQNVVGGIIDKALNNPKIERVPWKI